MAIIEYKVELERLREYAETFGEISWANESDKRISVPYKELLDIFGDKLEKKEKSKLVRIMCANSGFSDNWVFDNKKPPITIGAEFFDKQKFGNPVAAIIYPTNIDSGTAYHEGIHFLAKYGYKKSRLIKRDVPLAKVIGTFFSILEHPEEEFKFLTGDNLSEELLNLYKRTAVNPFKFQMTEHTEEENREASLFAIAAYSVAHKKGKKVALDFIKESYKEGI